MADMRDFIKTMATIGIALSFLYSFYTSVLAPDTSYLYYIPYWGLYFYAVDMTKAYDKFFALITAVSTISLIIVAYMSWQRGKKIDRIERRLFPDE